VYKKTTLIIIIIIIINSSSMKNASRLCLPRWWQLQAC